jgi:hypothetical protein
MVISTSMESGLPMFLMGNNLAATEFLSFCNQSKSEGDDDDGDIDIAPAA